MAKMQPPPKDDEASENAADVAQAIEAVAATMPPGSSLAPLLATLAPMIMKMVSDADAARKEAQAFHAMATAKLQALETAVRELTDALGSA